jgi:hypothetical protein
MRFSQLDDAVFALVRAGILTAAQGNRAHKKIARVQDGEIKRLLRAARDKAKP